MEPLVLNHPGWDPVALRLGPIQIHWYALMYLLGFALGYVLLARRLRHQPYARITEPAPWTRTDVEDLILGAIVGVIVGGRLGYCLFYKPLYYLGHPLEVFYVWQGGMSFHGGAIGVALALLWYAWRRHRPFLEVTDLLVPAVPTGLAAGRIGNFINGELWGRVAPHDLPWAMVFPQAGDEPRHPSQIYEVLLEGLLLFVLLWLYARRERARGQVSGAFVLGYGVFRFIAEYFREPDAHLGLLGLGLSMGQWLCVPMILGGLALWVVAKRRDRHAAPALAGATTAGAVEPTGSHPYRPAAAAATASEDAGDHRDGVATEGATPAHRSAGEAADDEKERAEKEPGEADPPVRDAAAEDAAAEDAREESPVGEGSPEKDAAGQEPPQQTPRTAAAVAPAGEDAAGSSAEKGSKDADEEPPRIPVAPKPRAHGSTARRATPAGPAALDDDRSADGPRA